MRINDIKIAYRITAAFVAAALFVVGITSFSLWSMSSVHADLGEARNLDRSALSQMAQLRNNVEMRSRCLRNLAIFTGAAELAAERRCVQDASANIAQTLGEFERQQHTSAALRDAISQAHAAEQAILPLTKNILRFSDAAGEGSDADLAAIQHEEMVALMRAQLVEREVALTQATQQLALSEREASQKPVERANDTYISIKRWLPIYMISFLVLGALLCWWITDNIVRPIRKAMNSAQQIATGNLSLSIDVQRRDETGQLLVALRSMQGGLHQIVEQIRQSTESIDSTSVSLNSGSADLAQRTQEQAATLEEAAASMEQFAASVQRNAKSASQANQFAQRAQSVAGASGTQMTEAVQSMSEILASGQRIGDITAVIDSIAFQTNILALNAAVEAARAGDQGRGFAVVAAEVRSLAQKSAEAAKEIKTLIEQTTRSVSAGTQRVELASATLDELLHEVAQVAQAMSEISTASREQALGIDQVTRAVTQLGQVTQQNSSVVEQGAAAAELLRLQAQQLLASVARFRLRGAGN